MITPYPPLSADEVFDFAPRPLTAEPHLTLIPLSCREFDAERIIATYQRASVVRTFERHKLTMDLVDELDALLDAYLSKATRTR